MLSTFSAGDSTFEALEVIVYKTVLSTFLLGDAFVHVSFVALDVILAGDHVLHIVTRTKISTFDVALTLARVSVLLGHAILLCRRKHDVQSRAPYVKLQDWMV